ncbi:MAG: nucleotide exchange factor GrpE [Oscillospiraceae bacterium]|nr:nucleotide exchange factor GrpE [Oscillospiraceae bacterium]
MNDEVNKEPTEGQESEIEIIDSPPAPSPDDQLEQEREKYLRLAAEYDNYRKRSKAERDSFYGEVKAETWKKILPVYDALFLAAAQNPDEEGYSLTLTKLRGIMADNGITSIPAYSVAKDGSQIFDVAFDPEIHNAIEHIEDAAFGANVVAALLLEGFTLNGKVIRHALVKVAN